MSIYQNFKKLHSILASYLLVSLTFFVVGCQSDPVIDDWDLSKHTEATNALKRICDNNAEVRTLLTKSLQQATVINPDKKYNPAQTLDELFDFIDWNVRALPWDVATGVAADKKTLYARVDQGVGYFWFLVQQPLEELKDRGYYYPTIEFVSPFSEWLATYSNCWGDWLSTPESWCDTYFNSVYSDPDWRFDKGWYGHTNTYHTFNEFFARPLVSPDMRPIGESEVVSCNDGWPKGLWQIDENSQLVYPEQEAVIMKTAKLSSVSDLIGEGSAYRNAFAGGTFTHSFLDVNDYHRYHCPVDGKIVELRHIQGVDAGGGITFWDNEQKIYYYENEVGFQMVETRACAIIETADYGLVAMLPIGMSQICSVNWTEGLHVGQDVHRGDEIGYFLFGGSDIVLLFQKGVDVKYLPAPDTHILMGESLMKLSKK